MSDFIARLRDGACLLLDGATGTELARRGFDVGGAGWSAAALVEAPDLVQAVHADYVSAGAEILTANTFRTHGRNLRQAGFRESAAELTIRAVELARRAGPQCLIAGSQAPLEDCYSPQLVSSESELREEHRAHARQLAEAGVDLILVETMNTVREAAAAAEGARSTGVPFCVSFVCTADAGGRLLSGESLAEAARAVVEEGAAAVLINCVAAPGVLRLLGTLRGAVPDVPIGAYANTGERHANGEWVETTATDPARYAEYAETWVRAGATLMGGCCGTTPSHLSRLRDLTQGVEARRRETGSRVAARRTVT